MANDGGNPPAAAPAAIPAAAPAKAASAMKVIARVRGLTEWEEGEKEVLAAGESANSIVINEPVNGYRNVFSYDSNVVWADTPSEELIAAFVPDLLDDFEAGFNCSVLAYGQTGSGRTHTMHGDPASEGTGIISVLAAELFDRISRRDASAQSKVHVSFIEIYNDKAFDLLAGKKGSETALRIREHRTLGPFVDGESLHSIASRDDFEELRRVARKRMRTAPTEISKSSSRSHTIVTLTLSTVDGDGAKSRKMVLADLGGTGQGDGSALGVAQKAGSFKKQMPSKRKQEGQAFNKVLSSLGKVITQLSKRKAGETGAHISYRDSSLTFLLKDALGGNSRTVVIATMSPAACNYEETLATMRFTEKSRKVLNTARINKVKRSASVSKMPPAEGADNGAHAADAQEQATQKAEEEAKLKAEEEARLKAEEEARLKAEEEARLKAAEKAKPATEEKEATRAESPIEVPFGFDGPEDDGGAAAAAEPAEDTDRPDSSDRNTQEESRENMPTLCAALRTEAFELGVTAKIVKYKDVFNSFTNTGQPKLYTVFVIQITPTTKVGKPWTVERRYNEFAQLHLDLKQTPHGRSLKLPGKLYVNVMKRNFSPAFLNKRMQRLQSYIDLILSVKDLKLHYFTRGFFATTGKGVIDNDTARKDRDEALQQWRRYTSSPPLGGGEASM